MNDSNIISINIPQRPKKAERIPVLIGRRYNVTPGTITQDKHGLCENSFFSETRGDTTQVNKNSTSFFIWDTDCDLTPGNIELTDANNKKINYESEEQLKTNRFTLGDHVFHQPVIIKEDSFQKLGAQVDFNFVYTPDQFAASLGMITLVNTSCFLTLKDGKKINLIDTDDQPVLYLDEQHPADIITPILETPVSSQSIEQCYSFPLSTRLDNTTYGNDYETMSVFSQYTSYIMHREMPFSENNAWTPACAPISWGWSMRTGFRTGGEACIIRQKLLPPTLSHEEHEIPCWEENNLALLKTV